MQGSPENTYDVISTVRMSDVAKGILVSYRIVEPEDPMPKREWFEDRLREGARVAIVGFLSVDRDLMEEARGLELIIAASSGVDHIDVEAAEERGICVANQPEAIAEAVAEYAIAGILAVLRNVVRGHYYVVEGLWERRGWPRHFRGGLILGRRLGLLGMGRIATLIAYKARALGVSRILYWSRTRKPQIELALGAEFSGDLERLFSESDIVVNTLPLNRETRSVVKLKHLLLLPQNAIFVNVGRGPTIEPGALEALVSERPDIALVIDVFEHEPLPSESTLVEHAGPERNIVLTPHIAGYSVESSLATRVLAAMQARSYLEGRGVWNPVNAVCKESREGPPSLTSVLTKIITKRP